MNYFLNCAIFCIFLFHLRQREERVECLLRFFLAFSFVLLDYSRVFLAMNFFLLFLLIVFFFELIRESMKLSSFFSLEFFFVRCCRFSVRGQ